MMSDLFHDLLGRNCAARNELTDEWGNYTQDTLKRLEAGGLSVFSFWNMQNTARQFYRTEE